jgi:hypothetical protein
MLFYDATYLDYVRNILRGKTTVDHVPTPQSWLYRKQAAELARRTENSNDVVEQTELVKQALAWIQLAENEEFLSLHRPASNDNLNPGELSYSGDEAGDELDNGQNTVAPFKGSP